MARYMTIAPQQANEIKTLMYANPQGIRGLTRFAKKTPVVDMAGKIKHIEDPKLDAYLDRTCLGVLEAHPSFRFQDADIRNLMLEMSKLEVELSVMPDWVLDHPMLEDPKTGAYRAGIVSLVAGTGAYAVFTLGMSETIAMSEATAIGTGISTAVLWLTGMYLMIREERRAHAERARVHAATMQPLWERMTQAIEAVVEKFEKG